jgi:cellulose synthase/poly-beta-1,6-N-acetylglucosamine synthase-like glycosyltransferase
MSAELLSPAAITVPQGLYILIGPCAWLLFAMGMVIAWHRMERLRRSKHDLPVPPPQVTILVPAKDEGKGVRECLERVLKLDYPNLSILAIDDRSTDQTGAIMEELAAANPGRLRAFHVPPGSLPAGWLGKCNALHTASREASGEWLLFVDSDVKVEPHSLTKVLSQAVAREYDAVSIMTRLECHSFWEALVLPLCAVSVGTICLMSVTNNERRKDVAFANGQFFLIRRSAYEQVGGHAAVHDHITEDVALMRILKAAGFRTRLYSGQDLASTRMHTTWPQMFNGWARIFSGVTERRPWRILAAMGFVAVSGLSGYAALVYGLSEAARFDEWTWLKLSVSHVALMTVVLAIIYNLSRNARWLALAFPLGGAVLLALYANAIRACYTGRIAWRGTQYVSGPPRDSSAASSSSQSPHGTPATRT